MVSVDSICTLFFWYKFKFIKNVMSCSNWTLKNIFVLYKFDNECMTLLGVFPSSRNDRDDSLTCIRSCLKRHFISQFKT